MYSPKVKKDLIPRLYQLKGKLKRPMTYLVNEAINQPIRDVLRPTLALPATGNVLEQSLLRSISKAS